MIDEGEERGIAIMTRLPLIELEHVMWGTNINLSPLHDVVKSEMYGESEWEELSGVRVDFREGIVWYELLFKVNARILIVRDAVVGVRCRVACDWWARWRRSGLRRWQNVAWL